MSLETRMQRHCGESHDEGYVTLSFHVLANDRNDGGKWSTRSQIKELRKVYNQGLFEGDGG